MTAFSVSSMLNNSNEQEQTTRPPRPAVLDISNLLCSSTDEASVPSLSPSLSPSPTSTPVYPFPPIILPPIDELSKHVDRDVMIWTPTNEIGNPMTSSLSLSSTSTATTNTTTSTTTTASTTAAANKEKPVFSCTNSSSTSAYSTCSSSASTSTSDSASQPPIKAKRKRANAKQLEVLNRVFDRTFFPSTQLRAELGRQLGMSPRTVQIWFQNRRQAIRNRERQRLLRIRDNNAVAAAAEK